MTLVAIVVVAVIAFVALRSPEGVPIADTSPTPTPAATPEAPPSPVVHDPVEGEREVETVVVAEGPIFDRSAAPGTDEAAVDAFVDAIADWLDAHLTDLHGGGPGLLEDVAAAGLIDSGETAELTSGLATFLEPVSSATYRFVVAADGAPEWAHVRVNISTGGQADEARSAELTFAVGDDGPLLLAAARVDPDDPRMRVPPPPEEGALR